MAALKKRIIVLVTQTDLGSERMSKMEIFVAYRYHKEAYPEHPDLCKSFTKIVNN